MPRSCRAPAGTRDGGDAARPCARSGPRRVVAPGRRSKPAGVLDGEGRAVGGDLRPADRAHGHGRGREAAEWAGRRRLGPPAIVRRRRSGPTSRPGGDCGATPGRGRAWSKFSCYGSFREGHASVRREEWPSLSEPAQPGSARRSGSSRPWRDAGPLRPGQVPGPRRRQPQPGRLLLYELVVTLTSWVPGALGLVLRKLAIRWLLGAVGPQRDLRPRASCCATRQDPPGRRRGGGRPGGPGRQGHGEPGHHGRQRRVPGPRARSSRARTATSSWATT